MRIVIVTDAWQPQTNGVVTTLQNVIRELRQCGHAVTVLHPGLCRTLPLPSYAEIRIATNPRKVIDDLEGLAPDAVHIATEGPLGVTVRNHLVRRGIPFCTSLHTKFPEYVNARTGLPVAVGYRFLRWFHRPAQRTLVTTATQQAELAARGLDDLVVWGRGVDTGLFRPAAHPELRGMGEPPVLLHVGRLAVEKNVSAFLALDVPGRKVVVGDGPQRRALERRFPDAEFLGYRKGEALAACYASADVMVFPSRTDTFGLVMLESMACGTPVAAYPVTGPKDVVIEGVNGALDEDLAAATSRALQVPRARCRASAATQSWAAIAQRFVDHLVPIRWPAGRGRGRQVRPSPA